MEGFSPSLPPEMTNDETRFELILASAHQCVEKSSQPFTVRTFWLCINCVDSYYRLLVALREWIKLLLLLRLLLREAAPLKTAVLREGVLT